MRSRTGGLSFDNIWSHLVKGFICSVYLSVQVTLHVARPTAAHVSFCWALLFAVCVKMLVRGDVSFQLPS